MTDTANLEDGFYWVRKGNNWEIAYIDIYESVFYVYGTKKPFLQSFFDEIDPRPIKREDVK